MVDLKKDSIFERLIAKTGGVKIKTTSFALPGLEPGAIVEYGWTERHEDELANFIRLPLQREYPVQTVRYHIKPLSSPYFPYTMKAQTFHAQPTPFEKEPNGFVGVTFTNLPAVREEPDMPPENEVSGWMPIYYAPDSNMSADKYWRANGKAEYERFKQRMKVNDDIRRKASELVQGATDDRDKLKRLFLFCRSSIKNVNDAGADLTPEQRTASKEKRRRPTP